MSRGHARRGATTTTHVLRMFTTTAGTHHGQSHPLQSPSLWSTILLDMKLPVSYFINVMIASAGPSCQESSISENNSR